MHLLPSARQRPAPGDVVAAPAPQRVRRSIRDRSLCYGIPAVVTALLAQTWFSAGRFSAGGDVSPFIRDAQAAEIGWLWTHQTSGAGSASTEIARALEVGAAWLVTTLGGTPMLAQRIFMTGVLVATAVGAAYFAGALTRRTPLVVACGLLGVLNPLLLIAAFNPVLIAPIGVVGLLGGVVLRRASGREVSPALLALATVPLSYFGLNPPTLLMTVAAISLIAVGATLLVGEGGTRRAVALLLRTAPLALLLGLWWIVPVALTLFGTDGPAVAAETSVTAWAWTHAQSDPADVAALTAHWTWGRPEYLPATARLGQPSWAWMRFVLPALAFTAPLVATRERRRRATVVAGIAAVLVVIGKGLHPPLSELNLWLYDHVPGLWLLREPVGKIGPLLLMSYVVLLIDSVESLMERAARRRRLAAFALRTVPWLLIASLVYPWPLYTGAVVPESRPPLPGARVELPPAWAELAAAVNDDDVPGKVVVLPLNPYYQVTTAWGYHGVDTIAQQLLHRPVLQRLPGGYFAEPAGYDGLLDGVERALVAGEGDVAVRLLHALGVSHVLIRRDLVPGPTGLGFADPAAIAATAHATTALDTVIDSEVATVLRLTGAAGPVRAYREMTVAEDGQGKAADVSRALAALPSSGTLVEPGTLPAGAARESSLLLDGAATGTMDIHLPASGTAQILRGGDTSMWDIERHDHAIRLRERVEVRIDDEGVSQPRTLDLAASADSLLAVLPPAADRVTILEGRDSARLQSGMRIAALLPTDGESLVPTGPVSDCNAVDDRRPDAIDLGGTVGPTGVRLTAAAHSACIAARIPDAGSEAVHEITLQARTHAGQPARICVWEIGPDRCVARERVPGSSFADVRLLVRPAAEAAGVELYLYADGADDGVVTRTEYRDLTVRRYQIDDAATVEVPPPPVTDVALDAGPHRLAVSQSVPTTTLGDLGPVSDCRRYDERSPEEVGLAATPIPGGVRLQAVDHSACVSAALQAERLEAAYTLSVEHRTLQGEPARLCVWNPGAEACSDLPELAQRETWSTYETPVRPLPGATGVEIFLYADGGGEDATITEYRNLRLAPRLTTSVTVRPTADDQAAPPPAVTATSDTPARYAVGVQEATGMFVLALTEAHDPGWQLEGLPASWRASHIQVDGYANGWLLAPGPGAPTELSVALVHVPSRHARLALWLSLATAALVLCWLAWRGLERARRSRRPVQAWSMPARLLGPEAAAHTYAWWLTGDREQATVAACIALEREPARDDDALHAVLAAVRAAASDTPMMCAGSEVALLHDRMDLPLDRAADLLAIDVDRARTELAHGRLEALPQTVRQSFAHPERLGGLAVGDPRDVAHARQCASCGPLRELILEGRQAILDLPDRGDPGDDRGPHPGDHPYT